MSVVGVRWAMAVLAAASSCVAAVDRPHDCTPRHAKYGNNTMREEQTAESTRSRATGRVLTLPMGLGWAERRVVRGPQGPPCSSAPVSTACWPEAAARTENNNGLKPFCLYICDHESYTDCHTVSQRSEVTCIDNSGLKSTTLYTA